jgi:hypothetical protein
MHENVKKPSILENRESENYCHCTTAADRLETYSKLCIKSLKLAPNYAENYLGPAPNYAEKTTKKNT